MNITKEKIALIQKILNARITKAELKEVTDKAEEILNRRQTKTK